MSGTTNSANDWAIIAYYVVSGIRDRHSQEYVREMASRDPQALCYRGGLP